ncbi:MAG: polysaccharide pyruvyl transferase family protein [Eubacteriales bacterium]|nr:polysaccharide pyruvyl transferase family protein [Eubacteriales bacterium]
MKYARIIYGNNRKQLQARQFVNLGDYYQTFAIDHIYEQMGVPREEIVSIKKNDLTTYDGEEVILPMEGWFGMIVGAQIYPLSPKIRPVYIGYNCVTDLFYRKEMLETYRRFAPVGCRDEATYERMVKKGIDAYLSGCLTITLPGRDESEAARKRRTKIFLVDVPERIKEYLPEEYRGRTVELTQEMPIRTQEPDERELPRLERISRERLERYRDEAALVVTSRLHCGSPCLGMGIPVIMVRDYFDDRYAWLDKYVRLYTPDRFGEIDWHPTVPESVEEIKPLLTELAVRELRRAMKEASAGQRQSVSGGYAEESAGERRRSEETGEAECGDKSEDVPSPEGMPLPQLRSQVHGWYVNRTREKITNPLQMTAFLWLHERCPKLADFVREVLLSRFSVATGRGSSDNAQE